MADPIIVSPIGNLPLSDIRRRASNMARSVAEKFEKGELVLQVDIDYLQMMAEVLNPYYEPRKKENTG